MIQEIVSGLSMGCIYALVGFGFVLTYNALGAVNFAYGEIVMFGGYFGLVATAWLGLPLWSALIFSMVAMAALGIFNMLFAYYPMRHSPAVTVIIASIGMSILLRNSALAIWGPDPLKLESFLGDGTFNLGGVVIVRHQVLIFAVTALVFVGQYLFFARTLSRERLATHVSRYPLRLPVSLNSATDCTKETKTSCTTSSAALWSCKRAFANVSRKSL